MNLLSIILGGGVHGKVCWLIAYYGVRQKDEKRLKSAAKSATPRAKSNRRKRKEQKFTNRRQIEQTEGARYGAGIAD